MSSLSIDPKEEEARKKTRELIKLGRKVAQEKESKLSPYARFQIKLAKQYLRQFQLKSFRHWKELVQEKRPSRCPDCNQEDGEQRALHVENCPIAKSEWEDIERKLRKYQRTLWKQSREKMSLITRRWLKERLKFGGVPIPWAEWYEEEEKIKT